MSGHDYIRVYDGGSNHSDLIKSMTGDYSYTKVSSPRNQMFIEFETTGSPHFTRFHITRFTLYTRLRFLPSEFTLCNTLHVFLTLHCQKYYFSSTSSTKLLCFTLHEFQFTRFIQKNKNRVK